MRTEAKKRADDKKVPQLVLTRFNLAINFGGERRYDSTVPETEPWLDNEYLKKRFDIFEKYTFPSFLHQTEQDYKWIVLFHKETPEIYKSKIKEFSERMQQFEAWFLDNEECFRFKDILRVYIAQEYADIGVITTRVDNDDMVHTKFLESIKKDIVVSNQTQVITYTNGLQYDSRKKEIVKYNYINNHFLSLYVPDTKGENHILLYNHAEIDDNILANGIEKIEKNTEIPLWIEIITETNFSNAPRWRFSALVVPYKVKAEYPLLPLKWDSKVKWCGEIIAGIGKVFWYRTKGLVRLLAGRKKI